MSKIVSTQDKIRLVTSEITVLDVKFKDKNDSDGKNQILSAIKEGDSEMLSNLHVCVEEAVKKAQEDSKTSEYFRNEEDVRHPLFPASKKTDDPAYAKCYAFNASSKFDVKVYDSEGNVIKEPMTEIRNGTITRLILDFKAYAIDEKPVVSIYLKAIQKLRDGEPVILKEAQSMWELFAEN